MNDKEDTLLTLSWLMILFLYFLLIYNGGIYPGRVLWFTTIIAGFITYFCKNKRGISKEKKKHLEYKLKYLYRYLLWVMMSVDLLSLSFAQYWSLIPNDRLLLVVCSHGICLISSIMLLIRIHRIRVLGMYKRDDFSIISFFLVKKSYINTYLEVDFFEMLFIIIGIILKIFYMSPKILKLKSLGDIVLREAVGIENDELRLLSQRDEVIDVFGEKNQVHDQYKFNFSYNQVTQRWELSKHTLDSINSTQKTILLILDSPHIDNFRYYDENGNQLRHRSPSLGVDQIKGIEPIGIADGSTGEILEKYFELVYRKISEKLNREYEYKVKIMSAVPYQTSLFALHKRQLKKSYKTLRNKVWEFAWRQAETKVTFEKILESTSPEITLNLSDRGINQHVDGFLNQLGFNHDIEIHPAAWTSDARLMRLHKKIMDEGMK